MIAKESVKSRIERPEQGISFTEFSYMLLQAYDFLHLHDTYGCRLQIGGSDQWGNITDGLDLIRKTRGDEALRVHLAAAAARRRHQVRQDRVRGGLARRRARRRPTSSTSTSCASPTTRWADCCASSRSSPTRRSPRSTSRSRPGPSAGRPSGPRRGRSCTLVHGEAETDRAEAASQALFSEDVARLDEATLLDGLRGRPVIDARHGPASTGTGSSSSRCSCRPASSRRSRAARTSLAQGGVYVNNRRAHAIRDARLTRDDLLHDRYIVLAEGTAGLPPAVLRVRVRRRRRLVELLVALLGSRLGVRRLSPAAPPTAGRPPIRSSEWASVARR